MTKFVVTVANRTNTARLPLRGTVIAFDMERAQQFDTKEEAEQAWAKASKFLTPATRKTMRINEV